MHLPDVHRQPARLPSAKDVLGAPVLMPAGHNQPQAPCSTSRRVYQILVGQLFDSVHRNLLPNQVITVDRDSGLILDVQSQSELASKGETEHGEDVTKIDLGHLTVIPGLVDVHVHFFLHPYSETSWEDQLTKESLSERTARATIHARRTLQAGFTTVRDLGTEGAFDADIGLRKCLSGRNPIIPGPRYYCSTRAIIATGAYGPKSTLYPSQEGIDGIKGAATVDGVDECVKEVRKQIGAGADWIKIYADYRCRSRMNDVSSLWASAFIPTFTKLELQAMINTAHARGVKVAAHADTAEAVRDLLDLEIDSIEHGSQIYNKCTGDKSLLRKLHSLGTIWVPTLAVYYTSALTGDRQAQDKWERCVSTFQQALLLGLENIACGGDTGVFAHGQNALELVLMCKLGASWDRVLSWATYGGWKCIRGMEWDGQEEGCPVRLPYPPEGPVEHDRGVPFGAIRPMWAADLVGVEGNIDGTPEEFEQAMMQGVKFVMKGGIIFRQDGQEVSNI